MTTFSSRRTGAFTGTGALIRLILRRDRLALPMWIGIVALLAASVAVSFVGLYNTPQEIQTAAAEAGGSPATVALLGSVYAPNVGALVAWRWTMQGIIVLGLFNLFMVIRHTRSDEEAGRRELIGSTVVGRQAPLTAALIVTLGADLVLAVLVAGLLTGLGLPAAGSLALGSSVAGACWVVAAVAGTAAQLAESAGAARGIAGAVFGLFYLLRALGDAGGAQSGLAWLSWLSPLGWARFTRPFAGEQWWILALFAVAAALCVTAAYALAARRDLGAGLLPPRPGPATAAPGLCSPLALAWRLQRGSLLAWTAGFAVIGVVFGFVATTVSNLLTANPQMMDFFNRLGGGARPSDVVFTLYFVAFGPVIAVYAISSVLRLRSQETDWLADPVLATSVSRTRWASSHLLVAALGQVAVLAALGLGSGLTYGLSSGGVARELPRVLAAALAYLPAVWVMGAVTTAFFGLLPRLTVGGWAALVVVVFLELGWELQQISRTVYDLSPFAHVPKVLVGQGPGWPLLGLFAVALALTAIGLVGFRRRDVR
jgi:ABC-2 type transport system permease protein